jgi:integrase
MLFDEIERPDTDMTIGWLVQTCLDKYVAVVKRPSSAATDTRLLNKHVLPHYADQPVAAFDVATVAAILSPLHARAPREAEKLRAVLSTMFNVAAGRTRKINMLDGTWLAPDYPNPVNGAQLPLRKAKSHKPARAELRDYLRGLDALGIAGPALRLQIQTFARISEITELPWSEIDLNEAVWTLPAARAKNDRQHRVMLSSQSVALLRAIRAGSDSPWVFPRGSDPTLAMGSAYIQRILSTNREALGVTAPELDPETGKTSVAGFTTHSVRHAGLTWLQASGAGRDVRDRVSNHAPPGDGADHIYAGASLDQPAREWTQRWADHLTSLEAENVVQLGEVRA